MKLISLILMKKEMLIYSNPPTYSKVRAWPRTLYEKNVTFSEFHQNWLPFEISFIKYVMRLYRDISTFSKLRW